MLAPLAASAQEHPLRALDDTGRRLAELEGTSQGNQQMSWCLEGVRTQHDYLVQQAQDIVSKRLVAVEQGETGGVESAVLRSIGATAVDLRNQADSCLVEFPDIVDATGPGSGPVVLQALRLSSGYDPFTPEARGMAGLRFITAETDMTFADISANWRPGEVSGSLSLYTYATWLGFGDLWPGVILEADLDDVRAAGTVRTTGWLGYLEGGGGAAIPWKGSGPVHGTAHATLYWEITWTWWGAIGLQANTRWTHPEPIEAWAMVMLEFDWRGNTRPW